MKQIFYKSVVTIAFPDGNNASDFLYIRGLADFVFEAGRSMIIVIEVSLSM